MAWDEEDDAEQHPAWCFCGDCGGDGEVATWSPGMVFDGDEELDGTVDEAVAFIKKMARDTSRTVKQAFRQYNHFEERNNDNMAFQISQGGGGGGQGQNRKRKGLAVLDPVKDLGADKRRIKILWAGDPKLANFNNDWAVVTLKLESVATKSRRLWTLSQNNPSLNVLVDGIDTDAEKWINRELWMWADANNPSETPYVRIEIIPLDATVAAAATATTPGTGSM